MKNHSACTLRFNLEIFLLMKAMEAQIDDVHDEDMLIHSIPHSQVFTEQHSVSNFQPYFEVLFV